MGIRFSHYTRIYRSNPVAAGMVQRAETEKIGLCFFIIVYGDVPLPMREEVRIQPVSPYGVTKLASKHLCDLDWKNFGLPTVSLRVSQCNGPRQRLIGYQQLRECNFPKKTHYGFWVTAARPGILPMSQMCRSQSRAANSPVNGEVFNFGGGSRISVIALIREIERYSGKTAQIQLRKFQKGDVNDTLAEISKAQKNWIGLPRVAIAVGVKKYIDCIGNKYQISEVMYLPSDCLAIRVQNLGRST